MNYESFFEQLTGCEPFPYQVRLATEPWPELVDVPTGLGKTAAAVVAWLYQRLQGEPQAGTRLIYCLPMRVLVEQTADAAQAWCTQAQPLFEAAGGRVPSVHVLMGGDVDDAWENHPEQPAILVGTQDMLLSRALHRGYGMSRYKWPVHFALLNNDCSWVFDETQLIGVGIETSAQLHGLRGKLGVHGAARSLWMSATLGERQLDTVDHPLPAQGWQTQALSAADLGHPLVRARVGAAKPMVRLDAARLDQESAKKGYVEALAAHVLAEHVARGGLSLVIVNRVARAQALYAALRRAEGQTEENTALVHSRFRAADRRREEALLLDTARARIVVATQAVEAGVDISARTLTTELAPWPSLVQRLGRCNRYGEGGARAWWVDIDSRDDKSGLALPYEPAGLEQARALLDELAARGGDAGPQNLQELGYEPPALVRPVIRRRDLLDLFDTTADLSGNDLDISRYVRDGEDTDVQLYWREFEEPEPSPELHTPAREELCRVGIAAARDFLGRLEKQRRKLAAGKEAERRRAGHLHAWRWDPLARAWQVTTRAHAGEVLLLHADAGGYDARQGWTGQVGPKQPVPPIAARGRATQDVDAIAGDPDSVLAQGRWVPLAAHLGHVRDEARALAQGAALSDFADVLAVAGLWHDVGKAHWAFQEKLLAPVASTPEQQPPAEGGPWAKSNHRLRSPAQRPQFRHELASALAWHASGDELDARRRDLVGYLIAAHHGKVRLSLRSLPGEAEPEQPGRLFARGVWDGDVLGSFSLPDGRCFEAVKLELSLMQLGEGSWLERALALRDAPELGPLRLALLETMLRVADWRASRKEEQGGYDA